MLERRVESNKVSIPITRPDILTTVVSAKDNLKRKPKKYYFPNLKVFSKFRIN